MRHLGKILRKFTISLIITTFCLILINGVLYGAYIYLSEEIQPNAMQNVLQTIANDLKQDTDNHFSLKPDSQTFLSEQDIWAMLLDNEDGTVLWESRLPEGFSHRYSTTDIAKFSRGYLMDYPVFVWEHSDGLLVLGYPKNSYTKQLSNYRTMKSFLSMPFFLLFLLVTDVLLLFLLYYRTELRTIKILEPFIDGISQLAKGNTVNLKAEEPLRELSEEINQVSRQLQKKDTARANWITGISHDIRTPLSVILGYADKLALAPSLPAENKAQAQQISRQAIKIQNLVIDLNLASKLEYNMQPLKATPINVAAFLRQIAVDFLNSELEEHYELDCQLEKLPPDLTITVDSSLLYRALENLIHNSFLHNPKGCRVLIDAMINESILEITIADNGVGLSSEKLKELQMQSHYMMSDSGTGNLHHGLGLVIVKQVMLAHSGNVSFSGNAEGGFTARLTLPINEKKR